MDLTRKIERMKDDCNRLKAPQTVREHLKSRLEYFRIQALCDLDRRDDQRKITEAWNEFVVFAKPTGLIRHFMSDPNVWNEFAIFVGAMMPVTRKSFPKPPGSFTPEPLNWEMDVFFDHLLREARFAKFETREEQFKVFCGLRYLVLESKQGRARRDHKFIKATWLTIWPTLNKHGLMAKFKDEAIMQNRLRFFVENSF